MKVINSTDDNKPGKVTILNRQPEAARALTATFDDPDGGVKELKWQWYRSVAPVNDNTRSGDYDPHAATFTPNIDAAQDVRYFIDIAPGEDTAVWVAIPGATSATYTPGYDEDSGGMLVTTGGGNAPLVERWTGGGHPRRDNNRNKRGQILCMDKSQVPAGRGDLPGCRRPHPRGTG